MESPAQNNRELVVHPESGDALTPSPDIRTHLIAKLQEIDAPTSGNVRSRQAAILWGASLLAVGLFAAIGGVRVAPRPTALIIATSAGSAAFAGVAAWLVVGRRHSMLSPPRTFLLALVAVLPALFLVWKVGVTSGFPNMDGIWPERPGWRCFRYSILIAAPLLAAFSYRWFRRDPTHPRATGAALGAVAGACSAVFVDLWCPVAYLPHLLLGHVLPTLLLAGIGATVGQFIFGLRSRAS
jgi:hypothetical protein